MVKFNLVEMPMNRRDEQYIPPLRYHWLTPFYDPIVRLTTQEFLQAVRRAVTPGGVVIANVWGRYYNPLYDSMVRTYQEVFDELFILDMQGAGNIILLALPRRQPLNRGELAQLARKVSTAKRFRFDLGNLVNYGFLRAQEKNERGRVLRDRDLEQRKQRSR